MNTASTHKAADQREAARATGLGSGGGKGNAPTMNGHAESAMPTQTPPNFYRITVRMPGGKTRRCFATLIRESATSLFFRVYRDDAMEIIVTTKGADLIEQLPARINLHYGEPEVIPS